uniref:Putative secreted protein n=1 Tax=Anopheles marajoara TaxID=58244 RepID=A0A2M4C690_9DIPT
MHFLLLLVHKNVPTSVAKVLLELAQLIFALSIHHSSRIELHLLRFNEDVLVATGCIDPRRNQPGVFGCIQRFRSSIVEHSSAEHTLLRIVVVRWMDGWFLLFQKTQNVHLGEGFWLAFVGRFKSIQLVSGAIDRRNGRRKAFLQIVDKLGREVL